MDLSLSNWVSWYVSLFPSCVAPLVQSILVAGKPVVLQFITKELRGTLSTVAM